MCCMYLFQYIFPVIRFRDFHRSLPILHKNELHRFEIGLSIIKYPFFLLYDSSLEI